MKIHVVPELLFVVASWFKKSECIFTDEHENDVPKLKYIITNIHDNKTDVITGGFRSFGNSDRHYIVELMNYSNPNPLVKFLTRWWNEGIMVNQWVSIFFKDEKPGWPLNGPDCCTQERRHDINQGMASAVEDAIGFAGESLYQFIVMSEKLIDNSVPRWVDHTFGRLLCLLIFGLAVFILILQLIVWPIAHFGSYISQLFMPA